MGKKPYTEEQRMYDEARELAQKKRYAEAIHIFNELVERNYTDAFYNLGECYFKGDGVEKDFAKAAELYRVAAEQGDGHSQRALAYLYSTGKGVEQSYQMAMKWYQKAADNNMSGAQENLDKCYELFMKSDMDGCVCKFCEKKMQIDEAKAHINKYSFLCVECYKKYLDENITKIPKIRKKIKRHYITLLIGMLVGFAIGLTLYFAIGLNVEGYRYFKIPVLLYLTFGFPSIALFLIMLFSLSDADFDFDLFFNPLGPIFLLLLILAFVITPFITIYKFIVNAINQSRLSKLEGLNLEMLVFLDQNTGLQQFFDSNYKSRECINLNGQVRDMEKYYR